MPSKTVGMNNEMKRSQMKDRIATSNRSFNPKGSMTMPAGSMPKSPVNNVK